MQKLILASSSPRRKDLLRLAGVPFRIVVPRIVEMQLRNETPQKMVERLAYAKAFKVAGQLKVKGNHFVLAADTTVALPGKNRVLGKPKSKKQAQHFLKLLAGRDHNVWTGFCVIRKHSGKLVWYRTKSIRTKVRIRKLTPLEILAYVNTGEARDKAGAYAAQGKGLALLEKVVGSFSNVMGLPVVEVTRVLMRAGFKWS